MQRRRPPTAGTQFKASVNALMRNLQSKSPNYIRCIKVSCALGEAGRGGPRRGQGEGWRGEGWAGRGSGRGEGCGKGQGGAG